MCLGRDAQIVVFQQPYSTLRTFLLHMSLSRTGVEMARHFLFYFILFNFIYSILFYSILFLFYFILFLS